MVNKIILIGNLGRDPETRYTPNGKAVTRFSLATSNKWVNTDGEKQQATEWHTIVVWGKQAEACGQYLERGRQVYVEGSLRYRSYEDKEGKERRVAEIIGQKVRFLGGGNGRTKEEITHPAEAERDEITF